MTNKEPIERNNRASSRRFITLRAEHSIEEVTIEAPSDQPVGKLIPEILKVLGWPDSSGDRQLTYELLSEAGDLLNPDETLDQSGVESSDVIWIRLAESEDSSSDDDPDGSVANGGSAPQSEVIPLESTRTESPRGPPAPPVEANIGIERPSLVSKEGLIFEIADPPLMVGRAGRNFNPEIDLTDLDPEFVSSRRHVRIESDDGRLLITALRTTNGTFINGFELSPGAKHVLESGDEVQFGFEGVKLSFFSPGQQIPASYFT